jgi:hypothetical protein
MHRRKVDLPEPLGPTRQSTSPRFTTSEMPFSTSFEPKLFETSSASTIGTSVPAGAVAAA